MVEVRLTRSLFCTNSIREYISVRKVWSVRASVRAATEPRHIRSEDCTLEWCASDQVRDYWGR